MAANLILSKESSESEIKAYFGAVLELSKSDNEFPINLDEVWMLVYGRKEEAVRALTSNEQFIENVDYQVLRKNAENSNGGRPSNEYKLTVSCMEFFIARKVRPVFEVYRKIFHKVTKHELSRKELALMVIQSEEEKERLLLENNHLSETVNLQAEEKQRFQPKIAFAECIMKSSDCISVGDMANILNQNNLFGKGKISFYRWLRYNGYLIQRGIRYNHPSQKSMKNNLMRLVEVPYTTRGTVAFNTISMITPYGQKYFINLFRKMKAGKSQPELLFEK